MGYRLKIVLLSFIAFMIMVGAVAMLLRIPNGSGFAISGVVVSGAPPLQAGSASIPGTHIASGPNISEYLVHLSSNQPLAQASQQGFHSNYQRQLSYYFPPTWIHNTRPGSGATSGGLPAATMYVPPTAVHYAFSGKDNTIYYDPTVFKHASIPGPDFTKLIPIDWAHVAFTTSNDYTTYVPNEKVHIDIGEEKTVYRPPNYVHLTVGSDSSVTVNPPRHFSSGSNATGLDPTEGGTLVHITTGEKKSTYVELKYHRHSFWQGGFGDNTEYFAAPPEPSPEPSPPAPTPKPVPPDNSH